MEWLIIAIITATAFALRKSPAKPVTVTTPSPSQIVSDVLIPEQNPPTLQGQLTQDNGAKLISTVQTPEIPIGASPIASNARYGAFPSKIPVPRIPLRTIQMQ